MTDAVERIMEQDTETTEYLTFGEALKSAREFTREEAAHMNTRKSLSGTVVWCDRGIKKCMLMCREKGSLKKVFSEPLSVRLSKNLYAGDIVSFRFGLDGERVYAAEVQKTGHVSVPDTGIPINRNVFVDNLTVLRYGINNATGEICRKQGIGREDLKKMLLENGHTLSDLTYIYIQKSNDRFRIFPRTSPIKGDMQVDDLGDFLVELDYLILGVREENGRFLTDEHIVEKQLTKEEEGKQRAAENLKKSMRATGFRNLVIAEIVALGFSEKEAKDFVKRHGLDKKVKNVMDSFDIPEDHAETMAKVLAKNYTEKKMPEKQRPEQTTEKLAANMKAKAKLQMAGYTTKEAKSLLNSGGGQTAE